MQVEAKIKYAKWKAADIMKALREGRTPVAGPPGGEADDENPEIEQQEEPSSDMPSEVSYQQTPSIAEFPSPPSNFTAPLPPSTPVNHQQQQPQQPQQPQSPVLPPSSTDMLHQASSGFPMSPSVDLSSHLPPPPTTIPGAAPSVSVTPSAPTINGMDRASAPSYQPTQAPVTTTTQRPSASNTDILNPTTVASAQKKAKWAISALNYDDLETARVQLLGALNDLGFNQSNNFGC